MDLNVSVEQAYSKRPINDVFCYYYADTKWFHKCNQYSNENGQSTTHSIDRKIVLLLFFKPIVEYFSFRLSTTKRKFLFAQEWYALYLKIFAQYFKIKLDLYKVNTVQPVLLSTLAFQSFVEYFFVVSSLLVRRIAPTCGFELLNVDVFHSAYKFKRVFMRKITMQYVLYPHTHTHTM